MPNAYGAASLGMTLLRACAFSGHSATTARDVEDFRTLRKRSVVDVLVAGCREVRGDTGDCDPRYGPSDRPASAVTHKECVTLATMLRPNQVLNLRRR